MSVYNACMLFYQLSWIDSSVHRHVLVLVMGVRISRCMKAKYDLASTQNYEIMI